MVIFHSFLNVNVYQRLYLILFTIPKHKPWTKRVNNGWLAFSTPYPKDCRTRSVEFRHNVSSKNIGLVHLTQTNQMANHEKPMGFI